ncbi:hypothetical protein NM688_g3837 [Phlebia brevispora]|uniref:Uncharacterized protein n=1 Tax=Phlebia brevispora TaxID=194682 RepID=A0ACC1T4W5_9APHY|nr:hypothetical protein NM688_g3837 [Phlebia brevispora]
MRIAKEDPMPCVNCSSSDAPDHEYDDWDYDVWLFWHSSSPQILLPLPRLEETPGLKAQEEGFETEQLRQGESSLLHEVLTRIVSSAVRSSKAHDSQSTASKMGAMGYSRVFRDGLISNAKVSPAIYPKL